MAEEQNQEREERRRRKRENVVSEIVSSEDTYLKRLLITKEVYILPIRERNLLSAVEIEGQFGEFEAIAELHKRLSSRLSSEHQEGSLAVGKVFQDISPEFSVYKGYLKCFEKALVKRGKLLTSNRKFAEYLAEAKSDPRSCGFSMESLLIEPVQRIPRYRLLLEDLLKCTPENHPDYESISAALDGICTIAAENNEAIRQQEEMDKVYQVMKQMEYNGSVNLLDNESRKFIKQDDLIRQCRRGRKPFRFWLFNDKLLYGEASTPPLGKYVLHREIPLEHCLVSSEEENGEYVMRIQSPAKSFIVWFKDIVERDGWVKEIQNYIKECQGTGGEGFVVAPIWNPDAYASSCSNCSTEFSFINRRHHCRKCGAIVCDGCSKSRIVLNHVDKAPVRVCNKCRDVIFSSGNANESERRSTAQTSIRTSSHAKLGTDQPVLRRSSSNPVSSTSANFVPAMPKPTGKPPPPRPSRSTSGGTQHSSANVDSTDKPSHAKPAPPPPPPKLHKSESAPTVASLGSQSDDSNECSNHVAATPQATPPPPPPRKPSKSDLKKSQPTTPPPKPMKKEASITGGVGSNNVETSDKGNTSGSFTLKELQAMNEPSLLEKNGITNLAEKEVYLSDSEFLKHFGCDKESFRALPAWKKANKRKELGIF